MSPGFFHHFYSVAHEPFWSPRSAPRTHFLLHIRTGRRDCRRTGTPLPLEATQPEKYAGWSQRDTRGTSSSGQADNTETREETKNIFCLLHQPNSGNCKHFPAARKALHVKPTKRIQTPKKEVYDLNQSIILQSYTLPANKPVQTWKLRFLRWTCSMRTCARLWKSLHKLNSTKNACNIN